MNFSIYTPNGPSTLARASLVSIKFLLGLTKADYEEEPALAVHDTCFVFFASNSNNITTAAVIRLR